jgi:predicted RNA-binding Zn-ribbon protein involved in translation (DUF1610 family)
VTCGETTPVLIDSQFCPACRIARLAPHRPLAGKPAEQLRRVQEAWSETRCPDCGDSRFCLRLSSRFPEDYRCEKCQSGWILRNGQFYGYDAATRAQRSAKKNPWTPLLDRLTKEIPLNTQSQALKQFVAMSENLDAATLNADLREWLLQVCEELVHWPEDILVFDSSDQEFRDSLAIPAAAAARVKTSLLGS